VLNCELVDLAAVAELTRRSSGDVRLAAQNDHVRVEVSDTGIGIPEAKQARLFERFLRTEAASGQSCQGTGLGLAISKSIVERPAPDPPGERRRGRDDVLGPVAALAYAYARKDPRHRR
jgi:hypothetical protein